MRRLLAAVLPFVVVAVASAQIPLPKPGARRAPALQPPPPPGVPGEANPFWLHPYGDGEQRIPCVHRKPQHQGGDLGPCLCPPVAEHPKGDTKKVPCVHQVQQHPGGDDTGRKVPCVHPTRTGPQHPGGDPVVVPCTHLTAQHQDGDAVTVPCTHLTKKHPAGEPGTTVPCTHLVAEHPGGDVEKGLCTHLLERKRSESDPPIDFYTDDAGVQQEVLDIVSRLKGMGVKFHWPRPLSVFYREPVRGNPDDDTDPFWSHYSIVQNVLVITKDPANYQPRTNGNGDTVEAARQRRLARRHFTVGHEFGHALVGNSCCYIKTPGGPHSIYDEKDIGLAMSEGWGHFVSAVVNNQRNAATAFYKDYELENGQNDSGGPFSEKVEFRVACILWDLYDSHAERLDTAAYDFSQLYQVFSPTLETLTEGPRIRSLDEYCERLVKNGASKGVVDAVRKFNTTPPR